MKPCALFVIALMNGLVGGYACAQPTLPLDSEESSAEAAKASRAETDDESFVASKRKTWVEVWGYHSGQGHDSATNSLQGRLYHSFPIGRSGAQAVTRLDTSINSTSGPKYTGGGGDAFNPGNTRWTLVGYTPEVAKDLTFGGGFRLIMPTGYNNPPYSSAQWAMGPQLAMTYSPKNAGKFSFFSPTARYLMGMTAVSPKVALMRTLELYPSVGFQLTPQIKLAFWSEYGMSMNAQTGKWFVPADAMVTYSFSKTWAASVGASAPIIKDNLLYFWNAYGRVVYNF